MLVIFKILLGKLLNNPPQIFLTSSQIIFSLKRKKNVSHKRRNLNDVLQNIQTILPLGKWKDSDGNIFSLQVEFEKVFF